ncbi:serine hydrolase domain-containing protein [Actinoplanes sp. NPDC024001]|uniref:serine hydrolase domain-containing protein n=1 Tax=Actinoplanes sp. NPDC024001 TaxID=3154598 RepID=UPI0033EF14D1
MTEPEVIGACRRISDEIARDPRYAHTTHLRVLLHGEPVFDRHFGGPVVADIFSVTKSVLATVYGVAAAQGLLPGLDEPLHEVLPELRDTPARGQTWRHLLTMTRGSVVDGPWDIDEVMALPHGRVARIAAAPRLDEPGTTFRYDNGAYHLLSAGLGRVLGRPLADYATDQVFRPLGITDAHWPADPDGVSYGFAHLRLSADALGRLGEQWRTNAIHAEMTRPHTAGGPPEQMPYGMGIWAGDGMVLAGGWAGQHVVVLPHAVVVTTGDPQFEFGPPPRDALPADWRPALELVRRHLLPVIRPAR